MKALKALRTQRAPLRPSLFLAALLIAGCGSSPQPLEVPEVAVDPTSATIDGLLLSARQASGTASAELILQATNLMIVEGMTAQASAAMASISQPDALGEELQHRYAMTKARLALAANNYQEALRWLTGELVQSINEQSEFAGDYYYLLGDTYTFGGDYTAAVSAYANLNSASRSSNDRSHHDPIWAALNELSDTQLSTLASNADNYELRGWIELARIYRVEQFSIKSQLDSITQWRRTWARHSASSSLPTPLQELQQTWENRPTHIALILPLQEPAGNAIQEGFLSAYYQALDVSREVPRISVYDSSGATSIYPLYDEAVSNDADLIIGPLNKQLVNQLQQLTELPVPTLALNYADIDSRQPAQLFQFGLAPEDEIQQAVDLAWAAGHRNAAIITPETVDYDRLQAVFSDIWTAKGGELVSATSFSGSTGYADVIKRLMAIDSSEGRADRLLNLLPRNSMEFTPRRRDDIDFIFLMANPRQGRQIKPTLAFYFAENIPVYAMPSIYDGTENQGENRDLDGITFTDAPWVLDKTDSFKSAVTNNLRQPQGALQRLRAMGIDSFRLYARLQQMAEGKVSNLQGTTGKLTMAENQRIHRSLEVARFEDGLAVPN